MYLMIPDVVLTSHKLSSDEKIILSYVLTLHNAGKKMFAKPEYLESLLGVPNAAQICEDLGERGYLVSTVQGKEPSNWVIKAMKERVQ
jgi:hypothetical protein